MQAPQEASVPSLGGDGPLEEGTATHSSILAGETPWTEEPGRRQSIRLQRAGHSCSDLHSRVARTQTGVIYIYAIVTLIL